MAGVLRVELRSDGLEPTMLPLHQTPMAGAVGFEPTGVLPSTVFKTVVISLSTTLPFWLGWLGSNQRMLESKSSALATRRHPNLFYSLITSMQQFFIILSAASCISGVLPAQHLASIIIFALGYIPRNMSALEITQISVQYPIKVILSMV